MASGQGSTPRRAYVHRPRAATLNCGCTVHYPAGVPIRRGETVLCAHHNRSATVTATRAT